jgi:hypothetical protein
MPCAFAPLHAGRRFALLLEAMLGRVWLVALLTLAAAAAAQDARASESKRVAVRVTDGTARALMQRIRGQTSDLDLELVESTEPAIEPRVSDEVATAYRLAHQQGARIVVWFEEGAAGLTLFFSLPDERRTLVRTIAEESAGAAPSSASFEAAALVVRSVLRALASGATIGVTLAAPLDVPPSEAAPPPPGPASEARAPKRPEARRPDAGSPWRWSAAAGWHGVVLDPRVFLQGGEVRADVGRGEVAGGLAVALDASSELADPDATVKLLRLAGGAFAAYAPKLGDRWRVALGVGGGAVGVHRETVRVASGVTRAPSAWLASALVWPEAAVSYRSRAPGAGLSWGVGLRLGADVVLTPPLIGNEVAGRFVTEHALWSFEPKLTVQVEIGGP